MCVYIYIYICIWDLERWYGWSYMKGNKGDTDVKNRLFDPVGEGKGGWFERIALKHTLPYVK